MPTKNSFIEFLNKKEVRYGLAALCAFFALSSAIELLSAETRKNLMHGGGGILIWGGWAVVNALHPSGRTVPGINIAINVGLVLLIASWVI